MNVIIPIDLSLAKKILQLSDDMQDIPIVMNGNAVGVANDNAKGCLWLDLTPEYLVKKDKDGSYTSVKMTALHIRTKGCGLLWEIKEVENGLYDRTI